MSKKRAKKNISPFFTWQNISTLICVSFLALLLWLFVKSEDEYKVNSEIPIEIRNLPSSFILNEEVPKSAVVQIKGQGRSLFKTFLLKSFFPEFKLILDIERISEEYNFILNEYFNRYPQKVAIPSNFDISFVEVVHPTSVRISLNEYREKEVLINPNLYIIPMSGYTLVGRPSIKPEAITITGSRKLVETIDYAYAKPETLVNVNENINISVPIEPPTGKVLEYSHNKFNFNQSIQKIDERIISEIPVKILNKDSKMRIFTSPQTVSLTVVGGAEYISSIDPTELEVSVDFNNWRKDKQFYEIRVKAPNDVIDWMDLSPMSIELIVSQKNN